MFYLIYGEDKKGEIKFNSLINDLLAKKPGTTLFKIDDENFYPARFEELILGQTLFDKKYIVAGRRIFANQIACQFIEENIEIIARSSHIFVFYDQVLPAGLLKKLTRYAAGVQEFAKISKKKPAVFNIFSLGDALGNRDRKRLWLTFAQALHLGIPAEEIFWQFFRTVKNLLLVKKTDQTDSLNWHPFVLLKTKKFAGNFSVVELSKLSGELVQIFYDVRSGQREMDVALELFVLEV